MLSPAEAILASWSFPPVVTALDLLATLLYIRGWLAIRPLLPDKFPAWRLACFLSGIATLQIALASPIDAFDAFFLADHMIQHLLLMMIVPPLILLGNPGIPVMRGLPRPLRRALGWLLKHDPLSWLASLFAQPSLCWLLFTISMLGWHLPRFYDLALRSPNWHDAEHATFLLTSILFWWPVIQPWPSRARLPRWGLIPYLLLADFANSALCAFLIFSERTFYPFYTQIPRIAALSVRDDQVIAGAIMWVIGSLAFLIPAVAIAVSLLSPQPRLTSRSRRAHPKATRLQDVILPVLILLLPVAALGYGFGSRGSVDIDGDVPLAHAVSGSLLVTIFAAPQPLPTGANDLAVLLQDAASGRPITDASIEVSATCDGQFACETQAVPQPASNKLLQAATLTFPTPSSWDVRTLVRTGNREFVLHSSVEVKSIVSQR